MIFACDIDGVLADIEPELNKRISEEFGVQQDEVKRSKFYMHERFSVDPIALDRLIQDTFDDPSFWLSAGTIQENIDAIYKIDTQHLVILITGRRNVAREATEKWLNKNWVYHDTLLMEALQVKHRAMKFAGCEFIIEDRYDEALTCVQQGFRGYVVRRHYNEEHRQKDEGVVWVDNLEEVFKLEGLL